MKFILKLASLDFHSMSWQFISLEACVTSDNVYVSEGVAIWLDAFFHYSSPPTLLIFIHSIPNCWCAGGVPAVSRITLQHTRTVPVTNTHITNNPSLPESSHYTCWAISRWSVWYVLVKKGWKLLSQTVLCRTQGEQLKQGRWRLRYSKKQRGWEVAEAERTLQQQEMLQGNQVSTSLRVISRC